MKHAREDYNRIQDPAGLIPVDEPVFLLRGQDILAPDLLVEWADRLEEAAGMRSHEMAKMVRKQAEAMRIWQEEHKSKIPDLPKE